VRPTKKTRELAETIDVPADEWVFFYNTTTQIREAYQLGMKKVVAFPSRTASMITFFWAKPDGLLVFLRELETMLSLDE
jgi:hypothetical protein